MSTERFESLLATEGKETACRYSPEHYFGIGERSLKDGRLDDAWAEFKLVFELATLRQTKAHALNCLGIIQSRKQQQEARQTFKDAAALDPNSPAIAHNHAFMALWEHDLDTAEYWMNRAKDIKAYHDTWLGLGNIKLLKGELKEGWECYEKRFEMGMAHRYEVAPLWNGEDLAGKQIFVYGEQGDGDMIWASRYLPLLKAEKVWLMVPPRLERWFYANFKNCEKPQEAKADYECPIMSLPRSFAPVFRANMERNIFSQGQRIGLVWAGGSAYPLDFARSLPLESAQALVKGCEERFVSLQVGPKSVHAQDLGIEDWSPRINDYQDTADILSEIKCLVTSDTSIMHLAATLGVPTLAMCGRYPDWRTGLTGHHSPWYGEHLEIFRQEVAGEWGPVIEQVRERMNL